MADVSIRENSLHIELTVPERVLSLHAGTLDIPLRQIVTAEAVPDVAALLRGAKESGAGTSTMPAVGIWRGDQGGRRFQDFVVVRRHGPGLVLNLRGGAFDRVLFDTPRADDLAAALSE